MLRFRGSVFLAAAAAAAAGGINFEGARREAPRLLVYREGD